MSLSRQFRALIRVTLLFSGLWAAIGVLIGLFRPVDPGGVGRLAALPTYALMFGSLGALSGIASSLLLARAEAGREGGRIAAPRLAAWGAVGGIAPPALFAVLALFFGGPPGSAIALGGLGVLGAVVGSSLGAAAGVAAGRAVRAPDDDPRLPAP